MIDDLIPWLRAQIDEDALVATAATTATGVADKPAAMAWHANHDSVYSGLADLNHSMRCDQHDEVPNECDDERILDVQCSEGEGSVAVHIARHDPARVLREVEAKRQIIAMAAEAEHKADAWPAEPDDVVATRVTMEKVLRLLALPYADRPGYREEWRP